MKSQALALFLFLTSAVPALADSGEGAYGHVHMLGGAGWGYMMMGPIMMIIFIGLVVLVVLAVIRWFGLGTTTGKSDEDRATALLRERFARGEIDEAEFETRLRTLEGRR